MSEDHLIVGGGVRVSSQAVHPKIDSDPNIHECHASELESKTEQAIEKGKNIYIGHTSNVGNTYLVHTSPKGKEWKEKFQKEETYWAGIRTSDPQQQVTEKGLIEKFRGLDLCTNGIAGKPDTTGFVYLLVGHEAGNETTNPQQQGTGKMPAGKHQTKQPTPCANGSKSGGKAGSDQVKQPTWSTSGTRSKLGTEVRQPTSSANGTKGKSGTGQVKQPTSSTSGTRGKSGTGQVRQPASSTSGTRGKSGTGQVKQPTSTTSGTRGKSGTGQVRLPASSSGGTRGKSSGGQRASRSK